MSNIKINDVYQRIQYDATASQTIFAIPFPFFENAYVYVWSNGTLLVEGGGAGQYGLSGAGSPSGGTLTLVTGATVHDIITIEGIMPIDRTSIYSATISNLTGSDLNGDFNREVVMMKQIETTQALLQLQYAPWALISQDDTVTKDRYIPLLPNLAAWRMNAGGTAIETFQTPATGGLAPDTANYLLQIANSDLPNAQVMGLLASGIVVNTFTTGVQLTRVLTGTTNQVDIASGNGISGNPTFSLSATLNLPGTFNIQGTTAVDSIINDDTMATAAADNLATALSVKNYVDGLDAGNVKSVTGTANRITSTGGANPVIDIASTYVGQSSITTLGTIATGVWQGTVVAPAYGGTGINNGSNTLTLAGTLQTIGAFSSIFRMSAATDVTFPTTGTLATTAGTVTNLSGTANQITASAAVGAVTLAIASNPVIPGTGGITWPTGTTAQQAGIAGTTRFNSQTSVFEGTLDGATWTPFSTAAGTVSSVTGTTDRITSTGGATPVIDIAATYVGQTSLTTLGTVTTGTWAATTVAINHGGTGVTSVTIAPTATAFAGWDANSNLSANAFLEGFATTVSAAGTTTLTVASKQIQELTGITTQIYELPIASTLVAGHSFYIINNSSGNLTINSSGGNAVLVMAANTTANVVCVLNSGTTAASWNSSYLYDLGAGVLSISGTANQVIASASTGNITLSLPQSIASSSSPTFAALTLTAALTVPNGGTGKQSTTAYTVLCGGTTSTSALQSIASVGTLGQVLTSNGAGALPTFKSITTSAVATTIQKFTSGSGTYTKPTSPAPLYIRVTMVGAGGGGSGTGTSPGAGTGGGNTTFGTTLLVANGGAASSGAGGTTSLGAAVGIGITGGVGQSAFQVVNCTGGVGAASALGGAGGGAGAGNAGGAGATNSGSGGAGGGATASSSSGYGGSAGGYVDAIITSPGATYSYAVGAAGTGGTVGTGGSAGGAGGSGLIVVYEFYQ